MKKSLLFIISISVCISSFTQTILKRQAYWGASFIPNNTAAGVIVQRMVAGSPAQLAGLQNGDVILKANGILLSDSYVYGKTFRSFRAGDKVLLTVLRNDKMIELSITPTPRPLEQYKDIEVQYGSVITDKGHHVRTILTKPAGARGKLPVIFVTQWLSCSQVEV
ncbi:MAG: PDZ domain-containing protein, partial [Chitinophagaceae bacterium]